MTYIFISSVIINIIVAIILFFNLRKDSNNNALFDINNKISRLAEGLDDISIGNNREICDKISSISGAIKGYKSALDDIPKKTLKSIQSSTSYHQGLVGEQMAYMRLKSEYDRVIPLGNIADFLCIKFGDRFIKGSIQLVDIKTGGAVLSEDQRKLKNLLENGNIGFYVLNIEKNEVVAYKNGK